MNRKEFIRFVAKNNGITLTASERAIDTVLDSIAEVINGGDELSIYGFGSFKLVHHKEKAYRHPTTGEIEVTPAKDTLKFIPGVAFH